MGEARRVVVTGAGIVSAIGFDEDEVWTSLREGRTGIRPLTTYDASEHRAPFGAEVDLERLRARVRELGRKAQDRTLDMAIVAADQALRQAGLIEERPHDTLQDVAVLFGSGCGTLQATAEGFERFSARGVRGMRPTSVPRIMDNAISAGLSLHFKLAGTNQIVVSACTSSTNAIGHALRLVRHGYADRVLCGGSDSIFFPFWYGTWNNLGVLAKGPDPATACRPFDRDRTGCVLGEGAGALVIESLESAQARGADVRAELAGYGESSDASHITSPTVAGQTKAMRRALADAGVEPSAVSFVNAHGTATAANDVTESLSVADVFGDDGPWVASYKSYFGHTLGASGALETIVSLRAMAEGQVPGNLNLDEPDPECPVKLLGPGSRDLDLEVSIKNSFGFGGGNGVLVLRRI